MPSSETSRVNLASARNPWTNRSREESALVWRLTLQWWLGGGDKRRNPRTQREWARQVGVSQPYVAKMVRKFKRDWLDMAGRWRDLPRATLEDLRLLAELRTAVSEPQPLAVSHHQQMPQQSHSTSHMAQRDAAILAYIGFNPNRTKSWF